MAGNGERDLILAPNEYALISDQTKGFVDVYVGPHKTSLANTDQPVIFDSRTKRFNHTSLENAICKKITAPEGWYVVLKNPEQRGNDHPKSGKAGAVDLSVGRKINIPGPVNFACWPGQMAEVVKGHHIRSNQYLVVRVYDDEAARKNWSSAIIKPRIEDGDDPVEAEAEASKILDQEILDLTMGKNIVIKGTNVSFYIPPTGVEVVPERETGKMVRNAVTLERLEYCLLLDESGEKRYEKGPKVVFPKPTEMFVQKNVAKSGDKTKKMTRKFRSIELSANSGIYVKVIADYVDEATGEKHKVGDELFITGKEQMIYFPREEHAIIKYGSQEIHYAIAIPEGEGRYVLDRNTGHVRIVQGPIVFLPDPRNEVVIQRALDLKTCSLMYPGNVDAAMFNAKLLGLTDDQIDFELKTWYKQFQASETQTRGGIVKAQSLAKQSLKLADSLGEAVQTTYLNNDSYTANTVNLRTAAKRFGGDEFDRGTKYTKPRTLVIKSGYESAVSMDVWTGYAVLLVRKTGERRIIVGPKTVMLEFDETPQVIVLSRGKPKTEKNVLKTVYLRVKNNRISDVVNVETKDMCKVNLDLSYRVNFTGDSEKWFEAENYVKFLVDHMRSLVRNSVKSYGIEEFYTNSVKIIRDAILGEQGEDGKRKGRVFEENGMHIYDVEVLNVQMDDMHVEEMLTQTQRAVTKNTLLLATERQRAQYEAEIEKLKQQTAKIKAETTKNEHELKHALIESEKKLQLAALESRSETGKREQETEIEKQESKVKIAEAIALAEKVKTDVEVDRKSRLAEVDLKNLTAEVQAVVDKSKAITPDLIAALQAFGDKELLRKVAESMAPMALLGGSSVTDVLSNLLKGTDIEKYLTKKIK